MKYSFIIILCFLITPAIHATPPDLKQAQTNLQQLQTKIARLQKDIAQDEKHRALLQQETTALEQKINEALKQIHMTEVRMKQKSLEHQALQQKIEQTQGLLHRHQTQLANQIQGRYRLHHPQPLLWFFHEPQNIDRLLHYYHYVLQTQQQKIQQIRAIQTALNQEQATYQHELAQFQYLQQKLKNQQQQLTQNKEKHAARLNQLNGHLQTKHQTLDMYHKNQLSLTHLVTHLAQQSVIQTRHPFTTMRRKLPSPLRMKSIKQQKLRQGVAFYAPLGTPVYNVFPGKVVFSDWLNGYGLLLIIDHGWGFMTLYANNQALFKQKGDLVNQGEQIATVGHSGGNLENSLYFEIRHRGRTVPPLDWLS